MKNKFVLCMVILANVVFFVKCQEISFDSIFSRIDTTRLSTNILYNSIFPLTKTRFTEFSGLEDTISIAGSEWKQLYSELYYAHLKSRTIPSYMTMYDSATLIVQQGKIPIGIINLKYNLIKENAFDDDLLQHDGLYVIDGNNQSENPYTENRCFSACVISDTIRSLSASFFLDDNLVFTENNEQIQFYEINFDDGNGYK